VPVVQDPPSKDPALGLLRVLRDDGRTDPATDPFLPSETLLAVHREMRVVRAVDTALVALQKQGRIGFHLASTGQEAVPVGTAFALEASDWVFPALRESVVLLARGFPLERYLAQSFGTADDVLDGRQIPGHQSSRTVRVVSGSSAVATQLPQAVGAAWAAKKAGARTVTVGFVGDGGTSTPDFHSAMNFAAVFRVPCIFVCQNNQLAISTPAACQTASASFAIKARAYGMPGVRIDGNDVLAVQRAVTDARVRAVAGGGPTLIEAVTYRMGPHSPSDDPSRYASDVARREWAEKDPIDRFKRHLAYLGLLTEEDDATLVADVAGKVASAIATAEAAPPPERPTLFDDVYAERPWNLVEQAQSLVRVPGGAR
jgi:pyruvate dehydrogenase E1 component alpha subunit